MKQKINVGAYIWPAYTGKEPRSRIFWQKGVGEWETVQKAKAKFEGHTWPRKPLLGYQDEADPTVMEQQIELAVSHGVNVFIYDWYWYDDRPFLQQCLDEGFLGAKNNSDIKFYLMWANHDANYLWDYRNACEEYRSTVIWQGKTNPKSFDTVVELWIEKYFTRENYYIINNRPLVAIYDLSNFINTFGGIKETAEAMKKSDEKAKKYGFDGIHFQIIHMGQKLNLSGIDSGNLRDDVVKSLPFRSATNYQYVHMFDVNQEYKDTTPYAIAEWHRIKDSLNITYFPHVSIGWDNNPRHETLFKPKILKNSNPRDFEEALREAKKFAESSGVDLVTINSWNEWTESSYLLPDDIHGYGYLDAIKKIFLNEE